MNFELILKFLGDLSENNSREWMEKQKPDYLEAKKEFEDIISQLIIDISVFEPEISTLTYKDCIFRIHRDIRFSKDKTPYKTNFGAAINKGGKKSPNATYYIHLQPQSCFIAGGLYMPPGEILQKIRQEIDYNSNEFGNILNASEFKKYFGHMEGDKLKRAPKGYDPDDPNIEWLKHKSFLVVHNVSDSQVTSKDFYDYTLKVFGKMKPFNDFLNRAID
jgi:uncharacterized protein (TIGR02453 family)